jgi:hypothetical protein
MCCVEKPCDTGWAEDPLPANCPPQKGIADPNGEVFFRATKAQAPSLDDFRSYQYLNPEIHFSGKECVARALSVWNSEDKCRALTLKSPDKGSFVTGVTLEKHSGVIQLRSDGHASWWVCGDYDILGHCAVVGGNANIEDNHDAEDDNNANAGDAGGGADGVDDGSEDDDGG